jgi:hypothetical protein
MKTVNTLLSVVLIAGMLSAGMALAEVSPAQAAPAAQEEIDQVLTKAYTAEQTWLSKQSTAMTKAYDAAAKVQELIDKASAEGLDVSVLQDALIAFNGSMTTVEAHHQEAANVLAAHAGFDAGGAVTDRAAARQTVMDGRRALGNAHMTMTPAFWALRDAINAWRNSTFPQG